MLFIFNHLHQFISGRNCIDYKFVHKTSILELIVYNKLEETLQAGVFNLDLPLCTSIATLKNSDKSFTSLIKYN